MLFYRWRSRHSRKWQKPKKTALRYWQRSLLSTVLVLLLSTCQSAEAHLQAIDVPQKKTTEILWDTYGIPHIFAQNAEQLFHAFGWAQMHSHGNLLLRLYGQARGRAAEYWGESYLESDRWIRTMGVPKRARDWYAAQTPTFRRYLDAFAAGINAYAQAHPELIADDVEAVLPIDAVDLLAHGQQVLHFTIVVNSQSLLEASEEQEPLGSNAWAIAPSHSASGNALLLANPHLPWSDRFLWYEAQLTAPGINAYGAALVGIPVLNVAFNDDLGWSHTINAHDGWDAYALTLAEGGYQFDGIVRPFETETQQLKVKAADGSLRTEPLIIRRSVHGPVVMEQDGKPIALRVVGLEQPGALEQWWQMATAKTLTAFEAALQRLQIPTFTVMYADRQGHILHLFNGRVPVRSQGNFDDWLGILPGDTSATLWTETHSYQELPRVLDPPSGWLQNANDPPWTTTFPPVLDPDRYPPYMAPRGTMWFRAQHSAKMLMEDEQLSFEEVIANKHSTEMELANRVLDDLLLATQQHGGALAKQAAEVLATWDRQANAESRGAVLFARWAEAIDSSELFAIPWDEANPLTTPDQLGNPAKVVATLETIAAEVKATYGSLDVSWGDVFRLRMDNLDLPANGGSGELGIFRHLWFAPQTDGRFQAIGGDSYTAVIEFSNPVRAMALMSYGNATQPHLPQAEAQLQLFAQKQLRPIWRSRSDIMAHLAARNTF
jgi:acyl-homoserine-lactone acylase